MESAIISVKDHHLLQKKSATGSISLNNDIIKKQSEQVCQDEVKIYMTHDFISAAFELSSFPITTI